MLRDLLLQDGLREDQIESFARDYANTSPYRSYVTFF